jgi:hypothetical protein
MSWFPRLKNCSVKVWILMAVLCGCPFIADAQLTPSSTIIDFGSVALQYPPAPATKIPQTVLLTNGSTTPTIIDAPTITGPTFTVTPLPSTPFSLAPGNSISVTVAFSPTAPGSYNGNLNIYTGSAVPQTLAASIPLIGKVLPGNIIADPADISFPSLQVNTSRKENVVLRNNGGTDVRIMSASNQGPFAVEGLSPGTITPGGSASIMIAFKPTSVGYSAGSVVVQSGDLAPLTINLSGGSDDVKSLPVCSLSKTNLGCKLIIDRNNPVAPPAVQMYSSQPIAIVVKHPKRYERYFLDYQTGQAAIFPDVTSSLAQGLLQNASKLTFLAPAAVPATPDPCTSSDIALDPLPQHVGDKLKPFQQCLTQLSSQAIAIYHELEPAITPDSFSASGVSPDIDEQEIQKSIKKFVASEILLSSKISAISSSPTLKASAVDATAIQDLTDLQKIADGVASNLMNFYQRLDDLKSFDNGHQDCSSLIDLTGDEKKQNVQCVYVMSHPDSDRVYEGMVTRTFTYSLDTLDLVSYSQQAAVNPSNKKSLASIPINYADLPNRFLGWPFTALRWEASAGLLFSGLPNRSYSVVSSPTVAIIDTKTGPTPIPFAAVNYRLTGDNLPGKWKSNFYWSAAIGVNPNNTTAEPAVGFSFGWRALMISTFCHFGRETHATKAFIQSGDTATTSTGGVPTTSYWTEALAFGISVRVPSLTGR